MIDALREHNCVEDHTERKSTGDFLILNLNCFALRERRQPLFSLRLLFRLPAFEAELGLVRAHAR